MRPKQAIATAEIAKAVDAEPYQFHSGEVKQSE
jgi:hypothetical protein